MFPTSVYQRSWVKITMTILLGMVGLTRVNDSQVFSLLGTSNGPWRMVRTNKNFIWVNFLDLQIFNADTIRFADISGN